MVRTGRFRFEPHHLRNPRPAGRLGPSDSLAPVRGVGRTRSIFQQAVKATAAGIDVLRRPASGVTILIYHRVGGVGGSVDLDPGRFRDQMAELSESGRLRSLDRALDELDPITPSTSFPSSSASSSPSSSPSSSSTSTSTSSTSSSSSSSPASSAPTSSSPSSPDRAPWPGPVVVTFDDGTADFVDHALPILVEHSVPTLLYAATRFIDEGLEFPGGGPAISWAGLGEACSTGLVEVGAHTHSHVLLDRLPLDEVAGELDRCDGLIEHHLDRPVHHFAYPKAVLGSAGAEAEVRRRYRSAAIAGTRPNPIRGTDRHRLHRSPIQVADDLRWFRRKAQGGMAFEDTLRRLANRRRYAGATT